MHQPRWTNRPTWLNYSWSGCSDSSGKETSVAENSLLKVRTESVALEHIDSGVVFGPQSCIVQQRSRKDRNISSLHWQCDRGRRIVFAQQPWRFVKAGAVRAGTHAKSGALRHVRQRQPRRNVRTVNFTIRNLAVKPRKTNMNDINC